MEILTRDLRGWVATVPRYETRREANNNMAALRASPYGKLGVRTVEVPDEEANFSWDVAKGASPLPNKFTRAPDGALKRRTAR